MDRKMFISSIGKSDKAVFARIMPNSNLVEEVKKICEENNICNGYISTCIGSLKKASFVYAIPNENTYFKMVYSKPYILEGPIEFISAQGIISKGETGEYMVHIHGVISDSEMNIYSGHILDEGNIVLATIDIVINELTDINLIRKYHAESGFYFFTPTVKEGL